MREQLDKTRREIFRGPFTIVAEYESGNTETISLIEEEEFVSDLGNGRWVLGTVIFPPLDEADRVICLTVYDDDWNALLIADDINIYVDAYEPMHVHNIATKWFYEIESGKY